MIASRLNMISSPPPLPSSTAETEKCRFFSLSLTTRCIITGEILFTEVCSLRRSDMSQVRLDGYMLRILQRRA